MTKLNRLFRATGFVLICVVIGVLINVFNIWVIRSFEMYPAIGLLSVIYLSAAIGFTYAYLGKK